MPRELRDSGGYRLCDRVRTGSYTLRSFAMNVFANYYAFPL